MFPNIIIIDSLQQEIKLYFLFQLFQDMHFFQNRENFIMTIILEFDYVITYVFPHALNADSFFLHTQIPTGIYLN